MLEKFRDTNFRADTIDRITQIQDIISEYDQKLTARQVFYQLVSRGLLENTERTYKGLTNLLTDARYAGMVDWDVIEDRGREPDRPTEFDDLSDLVEAALNSYRLPRWADQDTYVELWVEKQALAGVLAPIARRHHVTLMVNKGYSSSSAMKEAADRMLAATHWADALKEAEAHFGDGGDRDPEPQEKDYSHHDYDEVWDAWEERELARQATRDKWTKKGKKALDAEIAKMAKEIFKKTKSAIVLYLGDHDPSGEDMVRDIYDRLKEFGVGRLDVRKLALTMEQIQKWKPPPNPAKITDSRAKAYIAKFGDQSWELDALPPRELNRIVEAALVDIIDVAKMNAVIAREKTDREALRKAVGKLNGKGKKS